MTSTHIWSAFAVLTLFFGNAVNAQHTIKNVSIMSAEDEAALRHAVYNGELSTRSVENPGMGTLRVLVLPKKVGELYERDPYNTIRVLSVIVDGAELYDAHLARCCADALIVSPVAGAMSARMEFADYDNIVEGENFTERQHAVGGLREWLKEFRVANESAQREVHEGK